MKIAVQLDGQTNPKQEKWIGIKREPIDESEQPNDFKAELADKLKLERNIKVEPPDSGDENAGESVTVTPAGERNEVIMYYSRVPNITVGLNKSVGGNFSWKLIKK